MKKIAFHIQKGGVGKTSLSGNISAYLSGNYKTVLIDADPQGNSSSWFITDQKVKFELADVLQGNCQLTDALVKITDSFYLFPTFGIGGSLKLYSENKLNDEPFIFEDLCNELEKQLFQVCIFDLSPGMSRLEKSVLLCVDEVITPLTPEYFSLDGIEIFNNELKKINKSFRRDINHKKIVLNNLNKSFNRHLTNLEKIKRLDYDLFIIPQDSKLAEAQSNNKSIFEYLPGSKSVPELQKLALAIMEG